MFHDCRQMVLKYAGIETEIGQAVATLEQILCMTPRLEIRDEYFFIVKTPCLPVNLCTNMVE